jgi:glycosyltransferase involved in cell wall biosynthesis
MKVLYVIHYPFLGGPQNGYVVPIRDVDAIVDRVRVLADSESLRSSMAANARATAEKYSWEAFGRRLVGLVTGR